MDNKRFNLASHRAELVESCQKICLNEIDFKNLIVITKVWNHTRQFRPLEEQETRIRENQATIQATEEQLNQKGPTLIPSGSKGVDQTSSPVASHHSGTNRSVTKSHYSSQSQVFSTRRQGYKGKNKTPFQPKAERVRTNDPKADGSGERSTQKPEIDVNTSRISRLTNKNIPPTQIKHNVVTPESNLNSDKLWLQMSQFAVQTQELFYDLNRISENDIANTLQVLWKRTNIWRYSPYKSSGFKEEQPFRVEFKDKPRERVAEVAKKKNSHHNCGSTDNYANNCSKAKNKVYAIEKVPEGEYPTEDSESDSIIDSIREQSDDGHYPREELLVENQEEKPLEIQDIQLKEGMPQNTANKNLCKHTQYAQTFLVTPTKGMEYMHGTATKMTVCIENAQHQFIIDSGAHCSILATDYLDNHFPNWEKQLLPTKEKSFKSASGEMKSIGTIIKEIIIPHRKANIRLNPEFVVLEDSHIQGFLLGTVYQRVYGIDIYNSKNRHITIVTNKK
ncbi:hypothetical protein O181_067420 [Austropuccinia psidii MF-1]|uniref:Uncharacterized protein n=1 Tax=Austropuccinia psidii MF-1 TaxID=1389203 RepID=A0A9Q3EYY2_9BASI|nr:hypothetical protein [Austropuccinia psidii MF-1]